MRLNPSPKGSAWPKNGLDYVLNLPKGKVIRISQCDDGLWRLGADQALMELSGGSLRGVGEDLSPMGRRRVGEVEILESNAIRLRLSNTWYFPADAGEWMSLSVRRIRWGYTFYGDGRMITDVMLNNSGGEEISSVGITLPEPALFNEGGKGKVKRSPQFSGLAGRWCFLDAPETADGRTYEANFVRPGRIQVHIGQVERLEDIDEEAGLLKGRKNFSEWFDQPRGCYHLQARAGHCRFELIPPENGVRDAVVRVSGFAPPGKDATVVSVNSEGLVLRNIVRLKDGSALFILPGMTDKPRWVEVTGPPASGR